MRLLARSAFGLVAPAPATAAPTAPPPFAPAVLVVAGLAGKGALVAGLGLAVAGVE